MPYSARPRIAWFTTAPAENKNGSIIPCTVSGHVTKQILPRLSSEFEIEMFSDRNIEYGEGQRSAHYSRALAQHHTRSFDLFFYQVEDSPGADFVRAHLLCIPGTVLFHDVWLRPRSETRFLQRVKNSVMAAGLGLEAGDDRFVKQEGRRAWCALFSTERDVLDFARRGLQEETALQSSYLPFPLIDAIDWSADAQTFHRSNAPYTIAYCGGPEIEDRAHSLLEALRGFPGDWRLLWLIDEGEKSEVRALLQEFGFNESPDLGVILDSGRTPEAWASLVANADLALHLKCSAYGNYGPYLPLSLSAGVPAVVMRFGAAAELSEKIVCRIEPGIYEVKSLIDVLVASRSAGRGKFTPARCAAAKEYAREFHSADIVAAELASVLHRASKAFGAKTRSWCAEHGPAIERVLEIRALHPSENCSSDLPSRERIFPNMTSHSSC